MPRARAPRRPPASPRVLNEWSRRVEAEYRSAAFAQELAHWLIVLGAPEWLVRDCTRITLDELAHARLSHAVARAAGLLTPPRVVRESLALPREPGSPLEHDAVRVVLETFCLGETIAVRLFSAMRKGCDVPVASRALDRILRDEVRHRDFGWDALQWLLTLDLDGSLRVLVGRELPGLLERQRAAYAPEGLERERTLPREDARWGLIPGARYVALVGETPRRDYRPRLEKLGLALPR